VFCLVFFGFFLVFGADVERRGEAGFDLGTVTRFHDDEREDAPTAEPLVLPFSATSRLDTSPARESAFGSPEQVIEDLQTSIPEPGSRGSKVQLSHEV